MTHFGHDVPQTMVTLLTKAVGTFMLLVIFFIFRYIFELEFTCSCSPGGIHNLGILYMVMPPCIIYLLLYAINKKYHRLFCPFKRCNNVCSFISQQVVNLLSIGLFWIAAVLMDGDWYVCYQGNWDEVHMKIPCTKKDNMTYEDNMFIVKWKNESKSFGLYLTFVGAALWVLWSWCLIKCKCCEPYHKRLYKDHLSQETETNLRAALIELAYDRSKAIIREPISKIRESERLLGKTPDGNETRNHTAKEDVENAWNSISDICFYETEREESYEMSLFNRHLQKEKEKAVQESLQEMAEDQATCSNQRRLVEFINELSRGIARGGVERSTQVTDRPECERPLLEDA